MEPGTPGWASYVSSLEDFRKDLKQIHLLEEEMTRVKRDKEILVTRLIKQTKTRPTKSDIKDMASNLTRDYDIMSSQGSTYSFSSDQSTSHPGGANKENKRATKLKEAQAEYLGCEEHLRGLEVRIESERNKVMYRGLEERFRAMEVVGHMWLAQARRGLEDLEKLPELPYNAFDLESNGSLAPSQSASQVGYDEAGVHSPKRASGRQIVSLHGPRGPGSIDGSIAEEDEGAGGSSDDEPAGQFVVHENKQRQSVANGHGHSTAPSKPSPLAASYSPQRSSFPDTGRGPAGRKANSEMGAPSAYAPPPRNSLRRTVSDDRNSPRRAGSDTSSVRTVKRKGFFASIARFFKGPKPHKKRGERDHGSTHGAVTTYGDSGRSSGKAGWSTRTDDNLKRASTFQAGRRTRSESSSDDEPPNLVSVANDRTPGFNVADVGRVSSQKRPGVKRSSSGKSRGTALSTTSTVTARKAASAAGGAATPTPAGLSRSGTTKSAKSAKSDATARTAGTAKTGGTKTRANGSISRSKSMQAANAPNIMSIVGAPPPAMPAVPKAPSGDPSMHVVKAPGSSLVPADHVMSTSHTMPSLMLPSQHMMGTHMTGHSPSRHKDDAHDELRPSDSISRSNSTRTARSGKEVKEKRKSAEPHRAVSPLPPSKLRSPPLKSAMRPTSPSPRREHKEPAAPITTLYSITAPGPVQLPPDEPQPQPQRSLMSKRSSSAGGDNESIYESADEGGDAAPRNYESESEPETIDENYNVVENERIARIEGRELPHQQEPDMSAEAAHETLGSVVHAPGPITDAEEPKVGRRKSVRMSVPEGERDAEYYRVQAEQQEHENHLARVREQEKEAARAYQEAAASRDDSPPPSRMEGNWSTRIGHMREDTSDEEDLDPSYMKARRNLMATAEGDDDKKKKRKSGGSTRSKGSKASTTKSSRR